MNNQEYRRKYVNLRILKGVQEYLKSEKDAPSAVFPIRVPEELVYQILKSQGTESLDRLIHKIFKMGLDRWSDELYKEEFGSQESLEAFIELVKKRNRED